MTVSRKPSSERVLLIHPGIYERIKDRSYPPWGALAVAAACHLKGMHTLVVDLNGEDIDQRLHQEISDLDPTVIGLTAKLGNGARRLRRAIDAIRAISDVPIGVGGPLVSSFPDPSLPIWNQVDRLFWGDGEETFPTWIASGFEGTTDLQPAKASDLDTIGIPLWWDGLEEYISDAEWWPGLRVRSMHASATRGCSRRCTFCYLNEHQPLKRFRSVSPDRLMTDFAAAYAKWGVRGFYFVDDCFLVPDTPMTDRFLDMAIERDSFYRFGCDLQLHEMEDTAFLDRMYRAGFRSLYVGVESASLEVRKRLGKGRTRLPIERTLDTATKMGFTIRASIGIGWPEETENEMQATLQLIRDLPDLMFDAFRYTPLPQAPLTRYVSRPQHAGNLHPQTVSPFLDYSEYSEDFSNVDPQTAENLWNEMQALELERHHRYFQEIDPALEDAATG